MTFVLLISAHGSSTKIDWLLRVNFSGALREFETLRVITKGSQKFYFYMS